MPLEQPPPRQERKLMRKPKTKKQKVIDKNAVKLLAAELAGVLDELAGYCMFGADEEDIENPESESEYDEDDDREPSSFDPEDIQYALDGAISVLIDEEIIKVKKSKAPTLSEVLELVLGPDSSLVGEAGYFEDMINGYEGSVHIDDLREAHRILSSIIDELKSMQVTSGAGAKHA
jgi:hypothetical protein